MERKMGGIRWGKVAGKNRGGGTCHGEKARKCEKSEGKDSAKAKEGDQGIKKRGLFRSRRFKSSTGADKLIEIKGSHAHLCRNTVQKEGMVKDIDAYEAKGIKPDYPISGASVKTDACENGAVKKGMCAIEGVKYLKQGTCKNESMEDTKQRKRENECKEDAKQRAQGTTCSKQVVFSMEQGGNRVRAVGLDTSVKKEKKLDSPAKSIDKDGDVTKAAGNGKLEQEDVYVNEYSESGMIPDDFICGISKKVMADPVVIASGETFEREHIQAWLDAGNTRCPTTRQPLSHRELIPNLTLKALISTWHARRCRDSGLESADQSFASCVSSFSSYTDTPRAHPIGSPRHESFASCSSSSVTRCLEEAELNSSSSSSSLSSSLPKLLLEAEIRSFSSSTASAYNTQEHLRAEGIHNFLMTPSRAGSTSSWEREVETEMLKHCRSTDPILQSDKASTYLVSRIKSLVSDLESEYLDIQRSAAAELRLLAKNDDRQRLLIASTGALSPLVALLWSRDRSVQLEATTALLNLSINYSLRDAIVDAGAIEALVGVLRDGGLGAVVKENAAVTLACLAHTDQNKIKIGLAGAVKPLVNLLERGSPRGKKDAAAALYRLSSNDENKNRIVRAGAPRLLVDFILDEQDKDGMVDKAIAILGNLVSIEEGRVDFVEESGILPLMRVLRTGSERTKGLAVSILLQLCTHSSKHRSLVLQKEPLPTLMTLSRTGNMRFKSQVSEVIQVLIVDSD